MRAWLDAAVLVKTKNLNGRFVVRATAGLPFLLEEGMDVAFVPPQTDLPRNSRVAWVSDYDEDAARPTAEVEFEGVEGAAASKGLVGCHCLVRRTPDVVAAIEARPAGWEGWRVVDAELGEVGSVAGVQENPAHPLLLVERPDGGQAMVPVVDEFIVGVDAAERTVRVSIPAGLLDL